MADEELVKVTITCEEIVRYSATREIPKSAVEEYEAAVARKERDKWFADFAEKYVDRDLHVVDGDDFTEVELTKVKAEPR